MSRWEPFGFTKEGDVNQAEYEALLQAKYYLDQGCTLQAVRDWLVKKTGHNITIPGLIKTLKHADKKAKRHLDNSRCEPAVFSDRSESSEEHSI